MLVFVRVERRIFGRLWPPLTKLLRILETLLENLSRQQALPGRDHGRTRNKDAFQWPLPTISTLRSFALEHGCHGRERHRERSFWAAMTRNHALLLRRCDSRQYVTDR